MTPSGKHALIINECGRVAMECRLTLALPMEHIPAQHQCCTNVAREVCFSQEEEESIGGGKAFVMEKVPHKKCTGFPCLCRRVRRETIIYRKMGKKYFISCTKMVPLWGLAVFAASVSFFTLLTFRLLHDKREKLFGTSNETKLLLLCHDITIEHNPMPRQLE